MENKVKREIIMMFIPYLGTWYVIGRVIPNLSIDWFVTSDKGLLTILGMVYYQLIWWGVLKLAILYFQNK